MGSFAGHLLPGLGFIVLAVKWLYSICKSNISSSTHERQSKSRLLSPPREFVSQSIKYHQTFAQRTGSRQPGDSLLIISISSIGIIGELITGFDHGIFTHYGNMQHITMYSGYLVSAITSLLCHYKLPGVPKGLDYMTIALAVFIEGLLFTFHLHGRTPLDVIVHQFLVIVLVVSFFIIVIEWKYMNNVLVSVFRIYLVFLQGTWFIQVGFILYNPIPGSIPWADHDHGQIMIVTCIFCLHILFNFILIFSIYIITFRFDSIITSRSYKELPTQDIES